ncbi:MAG TPA: Rieske 2Fe-2S domain-containing protein [Candidatus Dormibacteraeota bacterium]|nr:Rieske 2Fe-2S domain-containing protein [Candidatus Dormibacteraeota bacterium]
MIRRFMTAVLNAQGGWSEPLGEWTQKRILLPVFHAVQPLKNFLHGTWLGHSLHAAITDVPIGAFTAAIILDIADVRPGADIAIAVGILGMLAAALAGWADYADTDVKPQRGYATVHQLLMLIALVLYVVSLAMRLGSPAAASRALPIALSWIGYVIIAVAAYVGGEVVYGLGNMVDRHAFRSFGSKWQPLELPNVADNTPAKAKAGGQTLLVVRRGERVYGMHDVCAHAGCNLSEGKVVGDTIECPCHGSRYRLEDGHVLQGPSTFDQPVYEVRRAGDGRFEARRAGGGPGE